jgi:hypothetical protein
MRYPPAYTKVILEVGDEYAIHSGATGGLNMSLPRLGGAGEPELSDELRAALEEALKDIDLDDLSGEASS